ncbi:hypothetical protein [Paenibacillus monticola]|uniref:Phosphoribulokinase/uridine kinase domain-containing protein n=1 Tax=Paenibacillus monticola TaxID=2666075 RepID=A0A7X2H6P2_9BACL|nr:hypothetical protein [Paenibacillus monticola]MRN54440.1 hypothetical protein [Paenibacillus monticola]
MAIDQIIYWIGGSACSGKSTLAKRYADKYGLELYACDEYYDKHMQNISRDKQPAMHKVSMMNPNEAFYTRDVQEQLRVYLQFFKEDFLLVLEDLAARPNVPIVVEGNQLLPHLVLPHLRPNHKGIWIIPSERFQREHYSQRSWIQELLQQTEDPTVSFNNWMSRDVLFAELIQQEANHLKLNLLKVDGVKSLQDNFELIEEYFSIGKNEN